jgi:hypothetical protein
MTAWSPGCPQAVHPALHPLRENSSYAIPQRGRPRSQLGLPLVLRPQECEYPHYRLRNRTRALPTTRPRASAIMSDPPDRIPRGMCVIIKEDLVLALRRTPAHRHREWVERPRADHRQSRSRAGLPAPDTPSIGSPKSHLALAARG